jgi:hypothetical protein
MVLIAGTAMGAILLNHHPRSQPPQVAASSPGPPAPGWQTVAAVQQRVAYQVPGSWSVLAPDTVVGFEDAGANPQVAMDGAAVYRQGFCPGESGSSRAGSGVSSSTGADMSALARGAARSWATAVYTPAAGGSPPTVTLGRTQAITAGGLQGEEVTARVVVHSTNPCDPPAAVVHVVAALTKSGGAVVLIVYADQRVPDAAGEQDLSRVVSSFRPTG